MEELYAQIGNYVTCAIADKESLNIMVEELIPLMRQVNYAALSVGELQLVNDSLGFGDQAQVILSNIVSIYRVNTGKSIETLLSSAGVSKEVISQVVSDNNLSWIPAGILLLGSNILNELRTEATGGPERGDTN